MLHIFFTDPTRDRKQAGASENLRQSELREGQPGFAPHGGERFGHLRLRHLSPVCISPLRTVDPRFALLKNDALNRYDVYSMMVYGFQNVYVSSFYIIALFLLTLHLTHGASSFLQSLGLNDKKLAPKLALIGSVFAWLIFLGYTSIPVAVLLGLVLPAQQL